MANQHEVRYLYQDTFTELSLYNETVLFIILLKKPIIIRVKNKEASDSFRKFFDTIWNQAKKEEVPAGRTEQMCSTPFFSLIFDVSTNLI